MDHGDRMTRGPAAASFGYPLAALAAAMLFQISGYQPCHLCQLQRMPLEVGAGFGALAILIARRGGRLETALVLLAALSILCSGAIGAFHAGVEYHWWSYDGSCTTQIHSGRDMLKEIMSAPVVPCDQPQWTVLGVSMAGMNATASTLVGLLLPMWQKLTINNERRGRHA